MQGLLDNLALNLEYTTLFWKYIFGFNIAVASLTLILRRIYNLYVSLTITDYFLLYFVNVIFLPNLSWMTQAMNLETKNLNNLPVLPI